MDDLCEFMLYVGHNCPKALEGLQLEEIMIFMVVFMGSPGYVKNPFVRSRISEVAFHTRHHFIVLPACVVLCCLHALHFADQLPESPTS